MHVSCQFKAVVLGIQRKSVSDTHVANVSNQYGALDGVGKSESVL